jgi:hypothetical protein
VLAPPLDVAADVAADVAELADVLLLPPPHADSSAGRATAAPATIELERKPRRLNDASRTDRGRIDARYSGSVFGRDINASRKFKTLSTEVDRSTSPSG